MLTLSLISQKYHIQHFFQHNVNCFKLIELTKLSKGFFSNFKYQNYVGLISLALYVIVTSPAVKRTASLKMTPPPFIADFHSQIYMSYA